VLGVEVLGGSEPRLALDCAEVRFVCADGGAEGIVEIAVALPDEVRAGRERVEVGSACIALAGLGDGV
jgi:hypothetical protein